MRVAPLLALLWSSTALAGWHPDVWDQLKLSEQLRVVTEASGGATIHGSTEQADAVVGQLVGTIPGAVHGTGGACTVEVVPERVRRWSLVLSDGCAPLQATAPLPERPTRDNGLKVFTASFAGEALGFMAGSLIGMQLDRERCRLSECTTPPSSAFSLPLSALGGTIVGAAVAPEGARRQVGVRGVQATAVSGIVMLGLWDAEADPALRTAGLGLWLVGTPLAMASRAGQVAKGVRVSAGPGFVQMKGKF